MQRDVTNIYYSLLIITDLKLKVMGKSKTLLFAGLVGLSATLTAQAQTPLPGMPAVKIEKSLKQGSAQNPSQLAMMKKKYPLLFQHKMLNIRSKSVV